MKGGLPCGVRCHLKLLEDKLGKCVHVEMPGGVRAGVECVVEDSRTSDGEAEGCAKRRGYLSSPDHIGLWYPVDDRPREERETFVVFYGADIARRSPRQGALRLGERGGQPR